MPRTPIHPGEILGDELEEIGLSAKRLADVIQVPPNRLYPRMSRAHRMLRLSNTADEGRSTCHAHPFTPEKSSATNWKRSAFRRNGSPMLSRCPPTGSTKFWLGSGT